MWLLCVMFAITFKKRTKGGTQIAHDRDISFSMYSKILCVGVQPSICLALVESDRVCLASPILASIKLYSPPMKLARDNIDHEAPVPILKISPNLKKGDIVNQFIDCEEVYKKLFDGEAVEFDLCEYNETTNKPGKFKVEYNKLTLGMTQRTEFKRTRQFN